jgi:predicted MarR family transcription regulator
MESCSDTTNAPLMCGGARVELPTAVVRLCLAPAPSHIVQAGAYDVCEVEYCLSFSSTAWRCVRIITGNAVYEMALDS